MSIKVNESPDNPFLITGYAGQEYFCDRETETAKVIGALGNGRNVTLTSPRRMGKTGLILHVFDTIKRQDKSAVCVYMDIFPTLNLRDFTLLFGKTLLGALDSRTDSAKRQIVEFFRNLRPVFSLDPSNLSPTVSLDLQESKTELGLKEIFDYLANAGRRVYVAIDEFQQITEYPEKGVEALLRSYIQFQTNARFIFAGSKKHLMEAMFSSANRPFYQSTQKIVLRTIPLESYSSFAERLFARGGKQMAEGVFEYVYELMSGHTWYVQDLMNMLYSLPQKTVTKEDVHRVVNDVIEEESSTYKTYCELVSKGQLRLLYAIARAGKVTKPYDAEFMRLNNLTAPSSVRQALAVLVEKGLVLKEDDDSYVIYDRFFSLWLRR